ncbi:MAG: hypothetical protein IT558_04975, partial [Alphaproteobacteria bacterium]|nr:hypothetical protein [Alphaproteobacteria bacterium]
LLFSETAGRIVVTVAPQNKKKFENTMSKLGQMHHIGSVAYSNKIHIKNVLQVDLDRLEEAYKAPLKDY